MGLATEQEAKLVAEMVARYPEVQAELAAIEESLENFDQKNAVAPPAHLKSQILSQIQKVSGSKFPVSGSERSVSSSEVENTERGSKVRMLNGSVSGEVKQNNFYKYAAGVALILMLVTGWYAFSLRSQLAERENELASARLDNELLNSNLATMDSLTQRLSDDKLALLSEVNLLKKPDMKSIELKGMEAAPDAKAMAYANTKTGEVYLEIMNLPAAPEGMQYQFWGIVDDKPVSAGMIPTAQDELAGIHPMTTVPQADAYAISLEPMGGSQQPTGKIYVMGTP